MNSQRKKNILYMVLSVAVYILNHFVGREVLAFLARYVFYWSISVVSVLLFVYCFLRTILEKKPTMEDDMADQCPYYVEPKNEEE